MLFDFWKKKKTSTDTVQQAQLKTENCAEDTKMKEQADEVGALSVVELMEIAEKEDLSIIISANEYGPHGKIFNNKRYPYYTIIRQRHKGGTDVYFCAGGINKEDVHENLPEGEACRRALEYTRSIPREKQQKPAEETGVLEWSLDESGTLVLCGNGSMASALISEERVITEEDLAFELEFGNWMLQEGDVDGALTLPWDGRRVRKAVVKPGLTTLSRSVFAPFSYYLGSFYHDPYEHLTEIILPDTVERLCHCAVCSCPNLEKVVVPASVKVIDKTVFEKCPKLTIYTTKGSYAEEYAKGKGLKVEIIEHSEQNSESSKDDDCRKPTKLLFDADIKRCEIVDDKECVLLQSVTADKANKDFIEKDGVLFSKDERTLLFYPPAKDGREYTIPETVTNIGKRAFQYNQNLERIYLPSSLHKIDAFAFFHCQSLQQISIPDTVWEIEASAFSDCEQLRRIEFAHVKNASAITSFPLKVKNIGVNGIFRGSMKLAEIHVDPENVLLKQIDGVVFTRDCYELIFYPPFKTDVEYEIPKSVTKIRSGAFSGAMFLEKVYVPGSVKNIETAAFFNCPKLSEIIFGYRFDYDVPMLTYANRPVYAHNAVAKCPLVTVTVYKNTEAARWAVYRDFPVKELSQDRQKDIALPSEWAIMIDWSASQEITLQYKNGQYRVSWCVRVKNVCNDAGEFQIPDISTMNFSTFCDLVNTNVYSMRLDPLSAEDTFARDRFESAQKRMKQ